MIQQTAEKKINFQSGLKDLQKKWFYGDASPNFVQLHPLLMIKISWSKENWLHPIFPSSYGEICRFGILACWLKQKQNKKELKLVLCESHACWISINVRQVKQSGHMDDFQFLVA